MRTVVTSRLRIETEALSTMDHMTSLGAIPSSRSFWNSNDPSLGPFDDVTLVMGSADEACSSTFQHLFPHSTGDSSACDESESIFNRAGAPSHPSLIFNVEAGGSAAAAEDQSSCLVATAHDSSYCTNDVESSLFTWSLPSSPPHYQAGELAPGNYDGGLDPSSIFGACAPDQVPFLKVPQPSFGASARKDHRNSWQQSTMSERNILHHAEQPLGSPCSVISGFTKALQEGENLYNMANDQAGISAAADQSISGTSHHVSCGGALKRKRSKVPKHSSEVESQRMTHIAVERNRRKQMNEHLAALRALMPGSYVQKGDQASIVGGAIEFVKELEHLLVCLQSQKRRRAYSDLSSPRTPTSRLAIGQPNPQPITQIITQPGPSFSFQNSPQTDGGAYNPGRPGMIALPSHEVGEAKSEAASVEVRLVAGAELQALVKVMALRRSGQLLRTVVALESLALTVVHANITTVNHTVLYSFQAHVGPLCRLTSHEIAASLHQTFASLHALQF